MFAAYQVRTNTPRTQAKRGVTARGVPEAMRAAICLRVLTDEQKRSGLGMKDQQVRAMGMTQVKCWPEPVEYADEGGTVSCP
jgi:hypothetical protein